MTAGYGGPIVDTDVHHQLVDSEVIEYLSPRWRDYATASGKPMSLIPVGFTPGGLIPSGGLRSDAFPDDGRYPGTNYELLREQLLDHYPYYRALLTHGLGDYATHLNQYFTIDLCRAVNDCNLERWLTRDDRLYTVAVVPTALPETAAAELRRVGRHDRIAGVLLSGNPLGRPFGDPLFHPIYEAADELDLPVVFHIAGSDRPNSQQRSVGGVKWSVMQHTPSSGHAAMHHISSFIVHGVFEKFPRARFLFNEYGCAWLPTLALRLDENVNLLRHESPWVKRAPSEYIVERIRLSTQPMEESPDDKQALITYLRTMDGIEDVLVFSSDYPHISFDDPTYVGRLIPGEWQRKVFADNACDFFRWERPPATLPVRAAAGVS